MTMNATGGPSVVWGQNPANPATGMVDEYNNNAGPSQFYSGTGLLDNRWGYQAYSSMAATLGFQGSTYIPVINATPYTLTVNNIANTQLTTTGVAMSLVTTSLTGVTVVSAATQVLPSGNSIPANSIALDGLPGRVIFDGVGIHGTATGGCQIYDPTKALARNIRITMQGNDTGYYVSGYDVYGYPMSEYIAGTTATTGGISSGKKAFKFVTSVVPKGTINSTGASVGTGDVYGFPIRADGFGDVAISYIAAITSSAGFTAAVTTAASTASGDVRGTYALQTASNNANVLQVFITPRVGNLPSANNSNISTGLFGVAQA